MHALKHYFCSSIALYPMSLPYKFFGQFGGPEASGGYFGVETV